MKKFLFTLAMLLCMAAPVSPAHALAISLFPRTGLDIHRFDDVFIDINIVGLQPGGLDRTLGAFELDLLFDPHVFQEIASPPVGWGSGLGSVAAGEALATMIQTAPGVLHISEVSLLEPSAAGCTFCIAPYLADLQGDSFRLATVGLYAYNPDFTDMITTVSTRMTVLGDGSGNRLPDVPDAMLPLFIPEPGTAPLLLLGLACAAAAGSLGAAAQNRCIRIVASMRPPSTAQ